MYVVTHKFSPNFLYYDGMTDSSRKGFVLGKYPSVAYAI